MRLKQRQKDAKEKHKAHKRTFSSTNVKFIRGIYRNTLNHVHNITFLLLRNKIEEFFYSLFLSQYQIANWQPIHQ